MQVSRGQQARKVDQQIQTDLIWPSSRELAEYGIQFREHDYDHLKLSANEDERRLEHKQFFGFTRRHLLEPFSEYYLLSQLENVIRRLDGRLDRVSQFEMKRIVNQLTNKIHGLLARRFLYSKQNNKSYYQVLEQKQNEFTRLQFRCSALEKKIERLEKTIKDYETQINALSGDFYKHETVAQQNKLYQGYFQDLKSVLTGKRLPEVDGILNKVLPLINNLEVNLAQIARNAGRNRGYKALISTFAGDLDRLYKKNEKDIQQKDLLDFAVRMFTATMQKDDNWLVNRYKMFTSYALLKERYIALISLLGRDIRRLLENTKQLSKEDIDDFMRPIPDEDGRTIQPIIVKDVINIGVIHCHGRQASDFARHQKEITQLLHAEFVRLIAKYPQLRKELNQRLTKLIDISAANLAIDYGEIDKFLLKETQIVHVNDVYNYYSKSDKESIYYLRAIVKALIDELKRVGQLPNVKVQLDTEILELLKKFDLTGVDLSHILSLFKPSPNICEVQVKVETSEFHPINTKQQLAIKVQEAKVFSNISHFAVKVEKGVPYQVEKARTYAVDKVLEVPTIRQIPYQVPTRFTEELVKQVYITDQKTLKETEEKVVQVAKQYLKTVPENVILYENKFTEIEKPYEVQKVQVKEIEVQKEVPKYLYKTIDNIRTFEITQPKVYKEKVVEVYEKHIQHVVVQEKPQFIDRQRVVIERHEYPKVVELVREIPMITEKHCDCQKPDAVTVEVDKPIYKEYPKEIYIERTHFVKGDLEERIVEIPSHIQIPIFTQVVKQVPVIIQHPLPFRTIEQKLVIVQKQIPFIIEKFTPVPLQIEKPVIIQQTIHQPFCMEKPVPIYIDRIVPKIVKVRQEIIVEKIVEVPRVEIVEKIVEKIVVVPRIVERIVPTIQIVEVPFYVEVPYPEIVYIETNKYIPSDVREVLKEVQVKVEVLRKQTEVVQVISQRIQQLRTIIQKEPEKIPTFEVEKLVQVIKQIPQILHQDRYIDRVVHTREIVPVEQRVEIPIEVQYPVEIKMPQPIFYSQPVVTVDVKQITRDVLVELYKTQTVIETQVVPHVIYEKQVVRPQPETIIVKEPQLHIVQVEKKEIVEAYEKSQQPVPCYFAQQKSHVVNQETFVVPTVQVYPLEKPQALSIDRYVPCKLQQTAIVETPHTMQVMRRDAFKQEFVKVVSQQVIAKKTEKKTQTIFVDDTKFQFVYQELPPKSYENTVLAIDKEVKVQRVNVTQDRFTVIEKPVQVPPTTILIDRIVENITMLPQIVEVEKKVYMIEEINGLIAKEVDLQTHYGDYKALMLKIQQEARNIEILLNQGRQGNIAEFKRLLAAFLALLRDEARMPKIVETIKQVEVIKERDRPVLVPVYDNERQKILQCIVFDLVRGIRQIDREKIDKVFKGAIRSILDSRFIVGVENQQQLRAVSEGSIRQAEKNWQQWISNYQKTHGVAVNQLSNQWIEQNYIKYYAESQHADPTVIKAALQRLALAYKQKGDQMAHMRLQYVLLNEGLKQLNEKLKLDEREQRNRRTDALNFLQKIKEFLRAQNHLNLVEEIQTFIQGQKTIFKSRSGIKEQSKGDDQERGDSSKYAIDYDLQDRIAQLLNEKSSLELESSQRAKIIEDLTLQNKIMRSDIEACKLDIAVWDRKEPDARLTHNNQQWQKRYNELENKYRIEIDQIRQELNKKLTDKSLQIVEQQKRNYETLKQRYLQLQQKIIATENENSNLTASYEQRLLDINRELSVSVSQYQALLKKNEGDRRALIEEYERRMSSTSTEQEKDLRKDLESTRRTLDSSEQKFKLQQKRIVDDYDRKLRESTTNQEQLRRELDQIKKRLEESEQRSKTDRKKITDDYERRLGLAAETQQQLRRELETVRRKLDECEERCKSERKKIVDEYEAKLRGRDGAQEKELRAEVDNLKKRLEAQQLSAENQRKKIIEEYDNRLKSTESSKEKQMARELESLRREYESAQKKIESSRSSGKGSSYTPEQVEEISVMRDKIKRLEVELESYRREIEQYQKSRLGKTAYSSNVKQSGQSSLMEGDFQSPDTGKYRSSGPKFEEKAIEGSAISKEQESDSQQRSVEPERGRISKSGVRAEKGSKFVEEGEQVRSSSSRVSGSSQTSKFKSSMTMKEFMDIKKADDKDNIVTLVMIKVIERIQEEADKGIINSYSPSNIFLTNFNPNNLDALNVRFGAPITNRKSKTDGLYLAPEVLRGQGTTLKSVVFTLAVIWDELIHYEIYYKTVGDIENLAYEYKVRDTSLNPILRNTLFEMMSKDPSRRLELAEAKRRLSLQRYIVGQARRV